MDQMRMDPKHQFAAQYVLSRAANERREREALLAAHLAMTTNMQPSLLSGHMTSAAAAHHMAAVAVSTAAAASSVANIGGTASPSAHSDSSTRISTPMNTAAEMKVNWQLLSKKVGWVQWCSKESLRVLFYEAKVPNSDKYSTI